MASPPNFLYMTETLEMDNNLLSRLQMSKYSRTTGKQSPHEQPLNEVCDQHACRERECRERHVWHADQLKLALHQVLPTTSPTLHRSIVLVRRFRKSISYKIENILSEIYFAANCWSSYIPSIFSWGTTSLSTKGITTLNSSTPDVSRVASQLSVNKPVSDEWSSANMLFRTSDAIASITSY